MTFLSVVESAHRRLRTRQEYHREETSKIWRGNFVIVAALGFLAWLGYGESKTYYHTIAELETLKGSSAEPKNAHRRTVAAGSIRHH